MKQDYGFEIARVRVHGPDPGTFAELIHAVLDEDGGARHLIPEMQRAYLAWLHGNRSFLGIATCLFREHPEAFNPPSELRRGEKVFTTDYKWPHWIYDLYLVDHPKRKASPAWEIEIFRSRDPGWEYRRVGNRQDLARYTKRTITFLEGRVTRLLYSI